MPYGTIKADAVENSNGDSLDLSQLTTENASTSSAGYMSAADKTKLDGIQAGATDDQSGAEIKALYEGEADTNAYTDAEKTKLTDLPDLTTLTTNLGGKADLVAGKLDASQLPDISISEFKGAVADEAAMLAITGEKGDWVTRSDDSKVYIITGDDPTSASDWTALSYPEATPTLQSVTDAGNNTSNGITIDTDKIALNADGSATFTGNVSTGPNESNRTVLSSGYGYAKYNGNSVWYGYGNGGIIISSTESAADATIKLEPNGSGTFGDTVTSGSTTRRGQFLGTCPSSVTASVADAFVASYDGSVVASVKYDGSAAFAGKVNALYYQTTRDLENKTFFEGALQKDGEAAKQTFIVTADGSAEFAGTIQSGGNAPGGEPGVKIYQNGNITVSKAAAGDATGRVFVVYDENAGVRSELFSNGSATFTGTITSPTSVTGIEGGELRVFGDYVSGSSSTGGAHISYEGASKASMITAGSNNSTGSRLDFAFPSGGEDPKANIKATINHVGDATFDGNIQAAGLTDGTTTKTMAEVLGGARNFTASGAITAGDPVNVNADGTVSKIDTVSFANPSALSSSFVGGSGTPQDHHTFTYHEDSGNLICFYSQNSQNRCQAQGITINADGTLNQSGSNVIVWDSSSAMNSTSSCYDSENKRALVFYGREASSNELYLGEVYYDSGIISTVSGGSALGGVSTFDTACSFDTNESMVLVAYQDSNDSNKGYLRVGAYDDLGGQYTFGSAVTFTGSDGVANLTLAYDSNTNKHLLGYSKTNDGFKYFFNVITVNSNGTVSIGDPLQATAGFTTAAGLGYDSTNQKFVAAYRFFDTGNTNAHQGGVQVLTISGTDVTGGTQTLFPAGFRPNGSTSCVFDPSQNLMVISFSNIDDDKRCTSISASVSGTTATLGTPLVHSAEDGENGENGFYPPNNTVVVAFEDQINSDHGAIHTFKSGTSGSTMTEGNFIGFAQTTVADGVACPIKLIGGIDNNQTGLTTGVRYYVQDDGSLGTSASTWASVVAGTAISATEIIIKN